MVVIKRKLLYFDNMGVFYRKNELISCQTKEKLISNRKFGIIYIDFTNTVNHVTNNFPWYYYKGKTKK